MNSKDKGGADFQVAGNGTFALGFALHKHLLILHISAKLSAPVSSSLPSFVRSLWAALPLETVESKGSEQTLAESRELCRLLLLVLFLTPCPRGLADAGSLTQLTPAPGGEAEWKKHLTFGRDHKHF